MKSPSRTVPRISPQAPPPCSDCHREGGDAGEWKTKTNATHSKKHPFPKEDGQLQVSCVGCHTAQNRLLASGGRGGNKAPTKCTQCHKRK